MVRYVDPSVEDHRFADTADRGTVVGFQPDILEVRKIHIVFEVFRGGGAAIDLDLFSAAVFLFRFATAGRQEKQQRKKKPGIFHACSFFWSGWFVVRILRGFTV